MPKGNYQCDKCSLVFTFHDSLVKHQDAHKLSESLPLENSANENYKLHNLEVKL